MCAQPLNIKDAGRFDSRGLAGSSGQIGHAAYRLYGRWHPSSGDRNLGDCFALAKSRGEPLSVKGNGFAKTDIAPAL